ncbi:MAG: hypothetical protein V1792_17570 [Pseudomonadota bacterium]
MDASITRKLWARIPAVRCKQGCCDCCKPFLWSEWQETEALDPGLAEQLRCRYLVEQRCLIYDQRPVICRLFGASAAPAFNCPHGCIAEDPLSPEETKQIVIQWLSLISSQEVGSCKHLT